jgi:membrane protein YdbS with pleckstrin-like domain
MRKKANTLLFILGATVANVLLTLISFAVFYLAYALLLAPRLPPDSVIWCLAALFLVALVVSFVVYQKLIRLFVKKVDVKKYFDPLTKGPTSRG